MRRAAFALLALVSACGEPEPARPNVLLITVDTLRADRLGCYGYARATTPELDALAQESARFVRAQTPRAKTTPALASLLTGLYPHDHGVRDLASPLAAHVPLLQEQLRQRGYATGAIVGNWVLGDARSGLARGFDLWCESFPERTGVPPDDAPQRTARSLTDAALVALGLAEPPAALEFEPRAALARGERPWFLWLHYMDPHGAYEPPPEHRVFERPAPAPVDVLAQPAEGALHAQRIARYNVPASAWLDADTLDAEAVRALYDGEVHYTDREIGRLLGALRASGELERTLVVVTSDHGESLGEHEYYFEHGAYAYESTGHVPLLIRSSGVPPGPREAPISLADLAPTLLDFLAIPPTGDAASALRGRSQAGLLRGVEPAPGAIFCEKVERAELDGAVQIKAVRLGDWKLIQRYASRPRARDGERETVVVGEELYDLAADPGETWNLALVPVAGAPLTELRRELARFVAADGDLEALGRLLSERRRGLEASDPEAARTLHLLGY